MGTLSLEAKKAYAARTRQSNYAASLRLAGFKMTLADGEKSLPSREEVLKAFSTRSN
ncbi:YhfG family protein [Pseudomonas fuscovaginae UPB0736]|uniref:YhfG family protein n=1 Tax=Pseudomonas asplenii TaxID=53407 RepID=UPI0002899D8F|nr:YhfG family protein [Pseudomonas fuscovaginae]UUQ65644.1 YhfG family protein [Pseudomonas fuscovaginae UPB0736]